MEVVAVLHMNGGVGETSYASNSALQKKVLSITKPIVKDAITELYCRSLLTRLAIADMGCGSGPNTFYAVSEIVGAIDGVCKKLGRQAPEIQVFLNDLPGNDFNTIFKSLPKIDVGSRPCLFAGAPGTFYGRLFLAETLHFVHSSYSLMWLSQVPPGLEDNKRNICLASESPPSVLEAYRRQFLRDFALFLKCRSEELVDGGCMVLTFLGRRSDDLSSQECCCTWELLAIALNQMVSEGLIEEEKLHAFNMPHYNPSPSDVKAGVAKEGSFAVNRLEVSQFDWNAIENESCPSDALKDRGYYLARFIRAVTEPLLASHFGGAVIDEVFCRYKDVAEERMARESVQFFNVTVSLTKGGA